MSKKGKSKYRGNILIYIAKPKMLSDFTSKHNGVMKTDLPSYPKQTKVDKKIFFKPFTSDIRQ